MRHRSIVRVDTLDDGLFTLTNRLHFRYAYERLLSSTAFSCSSTCSTAAAFKALVYALMAALGLFPLRRSLPCCLNACESGIATCPEVFASLSADEAVSDWDAFRGRTFCNSGLHIF